MSGLDPPTVTLDLMTTGPGPTSLCTGTGRWSAGNSPFPSHPLVRNPATLPLGLPRSWMEFLEAPSHQHPCPGELGPALGPEPSRTHGLGYCLATPRGSLTFLENMSFLWSVKFLSNEQFRTAREGEREKKRENTRARDALQNKVVCTVAIHVVSGLRSMKPIGRSWAPASKALCLLPSPS